MTSVCPPASLVASSVNLHLHLRTPLINSPLHFAVLDYFTNDHFFLPTTGRWLWNEPQKIQQHTSKFDVKALKNAVTKTAGLEGRSPGVHLEKLAEGGSNKVLAATIGRQRFVIKIPDPVVPQRLVMASEVATLEFLRAELRLPVPRVLTAGARTLHENSAVKLGD
ncbi:hypothetical protein PV04_03227 [Phialophora macrospora]|uniref:Aminoglycoside phosphotransferase domain-containing protein n=1 Tax=Phialophora macrospora TaxID=1851006 RepID=A0A0D2GFR2_9EURO|nr:hypothetical protein PV04_03227 [Phialophora macrospora]